MNGSALLHLSLSYVMPTAAAAVLGAGLGRLTLGWSGAAVCAASWAWAYLALEHRQMLQAGPIIAALLLCWWSSALTVFDLRSRRLPNVLTLPGAVVTTVASAASGHARGALMGAAILSLLYVLVHLSVPAGLGAGDVKLAWSIGALTGAAGPTAWTHAAVLAPVFTAVVGVAVWLVDRTDRRLPHGPSMCAATLLVLSAPSS